MNSLNSGVFRDKLSLPDGRQIPFVGMGTWKITDPDVLESAVDAAIEIGYRHFDSAELYENQEILG